MRNKNYALITPARNEEASIEGTIRSVISQTRPPSEWVIVSDGSTDSTDAIVQGYASRCGFIKLVRLESGKDRNFASKAAAFRAGHSSLMTNDYAFIGNLDADVTFAPGYYDTVIERFGQDKTLGIAGGVILEIIGDRYVEQKNSLESVAGAVQLFRRQCYADIGGYRPIPSGGVDSAAEIMARMKGWKVETFHDMKVFHHRRVSGSGLKSIRSRFIQGMTHHRLGNYPLFEVFKCIYRIGETPFVVGSLLTLAGFCWSSLTGRDKAVPEEAVRFLRAEQAARMRSAVKAVMLQKRQKEALR